jgi:hypothetical protein
MVVGRDYANIRAADADRERVASLLNTAYTEGRLTKDEFDDRLESAFAARTYADLNALLADLPLAPQAVQPAPPSAPVAPVAKTSGLAVASLICGLGQFAVGPLATIPAIVLGHMARHQIKRTGEQGAGLALAGLVLGWTAVIAGIILMTALAVAVSSHVAVPVHELPQPGMPNLPQP